MEDQDVLQRVARIDSMLERLQSLPDPVARATATETIQLLLEVYGEGLARVMAYIARAEDAALAAALTGDELVSHLLLVHGLHPLALDERIAGALQDVRPFVQSHGADVRLLQVDGDVARLRVEATGTAASGATHTLERAIEKAVRSAAPELERIEFDAAGSAFIPLAAVSRNGTAPPDRERPGA